MSKVKLSIVMPIFNAEKHLEKCLESIVRQDEFTNCELVMIDDCSSDKSREICEKYARQFQNILLICNDFNSGPGVSRNVGIKNCKGEYIYFIDGDDLLKEDSLNVIFSKIIEDPDFLFINHVFMDESGVITGESPKNNFDGDNLKEFVEFTFKKTVRYPAWKFVVRRTFVLENEINFSKSYIEEDVLFTWKLISLSKKAAFVKRPLYYYRINQKSSLMGRVANNTSKATNNLKIIAEDTVEFVQMLEARGLFSEKQEVQAKTFLLRYLQALLCVDEEEIFQTQESKRIVNGLKSVADDNTEYMDLIINNGVIEGAKKFKNVLYGCIDEALKSKKKICLMPYSPNIYSFKDLVHAYIGETAIIIDNNLGKTNEEIKTLAEIEGDSTFIIVSHIKDNVMLSIKNQLTELGKKEYEDYILIR